MLKPNALTTVERAKIIMNMMDNTRDTALEMLINSTSEAIEQYCSRKFKKDNYTEIFSGENTKSINLKNYPVHNITKVMIENIEMNLDFFKLDKERGILFNEKGIFSRGIRNIQIEYLGGYILPKDETPEQASDLPTTIEIACCIYTNTLFNTDPTKGAVTSERIGDYSVSYATDSNSGSAEINNEMPKTTTALIKSYVGRW